MKNFIIFFAVTIIISFSSCDKEFLEKEPPDKLPEAGFFNAADRALSGVNAIYISLASEYMHGRDNNGMRMFDPPTGDVIYVGLGQSFNRYSYTASDDVLLKFYSGCYEGIRRANVVIKDVSAINMDQNLKARYIGEAKFLRALFYWYLTTLWGEVPLITSPAVESRDVLVKKSTIAEINQQIVNDLKDAIQALPVASAYAAADKGRATKGAAQALLGKVHLYAKDYTQAELILGQLIASKTYALMDDFDQVWNRNFENNKESIFEVQFAGGNSGASSPVGNNDKHYWVNVAGGVGEFLPTKSLFDAFEPQDPRLNYTLFNYEGQPFAPQLTTSLLNLNTFKKSWSSTGFGVRKGLIPMVLPNGLTADATNFPIIRYADVLLLYAEAANEIGKYPEARDAINQVRQRPTVNMPPLTTINTGTKQLIFEAIVRERRIELAFEQHRFNDLKRWGLAEKELAHLGYTQSRHRYFPLPQSEIDINPNLEQLKGW